MVSLYYYFQHYLQLQQIFTVCLGDNCTIPFLHDIPTNTTFFTQITTYHFISVVKKKKKERLNLLCHYDYCNSLSS